LKKSFNKDIEEIIYQVNHPFILEASAGSGKTTLLVERYVALLFYLVAYEEKSSIDAVRGLIALTFTRKAADEMKDRIRKRILESFQENNIENILEKLKRYNSTEKSIEGLSRRIISKKYDLLNAIGMLKISTIHSFGLSILKSYPVESELDPNSSPQDETGIEELSITLKDAFSEAFRSMIDSNDENFGFAVRIMGYQKVKRIMEEMMRLVGNHGFSVLEKKIRDGKYLIFENIKNVEEEATKRLLPLLQSIQDCIEKLKNTVRKNVIPSLERINLEIEKIKEERDVSALFSSSVIYSGKSEQVRESLLPLIDKFYLELHRLIFPVLWRVFLRIKEFYEQLKTKRKEIQFTDIEEKLLKLLKKDTKILSNLKSQIRFLMVDEYQDTSDIQKEILDTLVYNRDGNFDVIPFFVGDPKQSIYGFRNADVSIFGNTKMEFTDKNPSSFCKINFNYRSSGNMVSDFNEIFKDVFASDYIEYFDQLPFKDIQNGSGVFFIPAIGEKALEIFENSCHRTAILIKELVNSGNYQPGEIMVLFRRKTHVQILREYFDRILSESGIPYFHIDTGNILNAPEIQNLLVYLKALDNPESNFYFLPLLKSPFFRKNDIEITTLLMQNKSLYEAVCMENSEEIEIFNSLKKLKNQLTISELSERIINKTAYFAFLNTLPERKEATTNIMVFLDYLRKIQNVEMFQLTDFIYYLQEYGVMLEKPQIIGEKSNVVKVMSIHAAKGLESRVVFYISSWGGKRRAGFFIWGRRNFECPFGLKIFGYDTNSRILMDSIDAEEMAEEKRLCYVAFTRAKELFYYVGVGFYKGDNNEEKKKDGKDGWRSFINIDKSFVQKRLLTEVGEIQKKIVPKEEDLIKPVAERFLFLQKNDHKLKTIILPEIITITQLLDIEFLEKAFIKRYIVRSFPVDEALNEIAIADIELLAKDMTQADEGTYLHKVFQHSDKSNYALFIENSIQNESNLIKNKKDSIIKKAQNFFESDFYERYYVESCKSFKEWEINYPVDYKGNTILIKGAVDVYIQRDERKGIIVDYKLRIKKNIERYSRQLNYYAYFLEKIGYPVEELFLFDIDEGMEIHVRKNLDGIESILKKNLEKMEKYY